MMANATPLYGDTTAFDSGTSPTVAIRKLDPIDKDDLAVRLKACRAIVREAARRVAAVGVGCMVEGVEELELSDRLESALHDYLKARSDPTSRRAYVGNTRGMDQIVADLARIPAKTAAETEEGADNGNG